MRVRIGLGNHKLCVGKFLIIRLLIYVNMPWTCVKNCGRSRKRRDGRSQIAAYLGVAQSTVNRWFDSVKPARPQGPHWDAVNRLYNEKVGSPDSTNTISLPNSLALKFFRLPEAKQAMILGLLGSIIELAEWRD